MIEKFDSVVIGGGPGGYVCAIRLSQLGQKTACIESRGALGGTCLNIGCIPSKSLLNLSENFKKAKNFSKLGIETGDVKLNLDKMMKNKEKAVSILTKGVEFLFKKNKVTYLKGFGSFISDKKISVKGEDGKKKEIEAKNIIIATGSEAMPMPNVEFDEKTIVSSTGALSLKEVPKSLVVVGGGYIGLEMGSVWSRLGAEVNVIEFLDHITPGMDREISEEFMKILKKQNIKFHLNRKVTSIKKTNNGVQISTSDKNGDSKEFNCDAPEGHNSFLYLLKGEIKIGVKDHDKTTDSNLILLERGNKLIVKAIKKSEFLFIAGKPIGEPIARGGPFVMNTKAEILEAIQDYNNGTFAKY